MLVYWYVSYIHTVNTYIKTYIHFKIEKNKVF